MFCFSRLCLLFSFTTFLSFLFFVSYLFFSSFLFRFISKIFPIFFLLIPSHSLLISSYSVSLVRFFPIFFSFHLILFSLTSLISSSLRTSLFNRRISSSLLIPPYSFLLLLPLHFPRLLILIPPSSSPLHSSPPICRSRRPINPGRERRGPGEGPRVHWDSRAHIRP